MTRTSKGFLDYEQGVTPPPARRRRAAPVMEGQGDLLAAVVPAARLSDPSTSNEGIHDVLPKAGSQQRKLLLAYASRPMGLTNEEAAEIAGLHVVGCCYWKRCADLLAAGLIEDTLTTRVASTGSEQRVCAISAKGKRALL